MAVFIYALFQDRSGALWIAVDEELDSFDPVTGGFFHYRQSQRPQAWPGRCGTSHRTGTECCGSHAQRLGPAGSGFRRFTHYRTTRASPSLASDDVRYLLEDCQGIALWVATAAGHAFDPGRKSHSPLSEFLASAPGPDLRRSLRDALALRDTAWGAYLARSKDGHLHNLHLFRRMA